MEKFAAARVGDLHLCPMPGPIGPHGIGQVFNCGTAKTVFIGGKDKNAAVIGSFIACFDSCPMTFIQQGSASVFIEKKPAARMGDTTSHQGMILSGCPTVSLGNSHAYLYTKEMVEELLGFKGPDPWVEISEEPPTDSYKEGEEPGVEIKEKPLPDSEKGVGPANLPPWMFP